METKFTAMDDDVVAQNNNWKNTKEAVANFRKLLVCSKCSSLMNEPVCLGTCEHLLCRSCAGPRAGDGCVVCHSPAWVKDIQINRQLSSIVQLFSDLESLLSPADQPDHSPVRTLTPPESPSVKPKKNFKIWFSPRSRKVRCTVEKRSEVTVPESRTSKGGNSTQPLNTPAQSGDLSVFNFASSSQDSSSSCSQISKNGNGKKKVVKKTAAMRKNSATILATRKQKVETVRKSRLEAINQQWCVMEEPESLKDKEEANVEKTKRSSKRVSFQSPAVSAEEPGVSSANLSPGSSAVAENPPEVNSVLSDQTQTEPSGGVAPQLKPPTQSSGSDRSPDQLHAISPAKQSLKRDEAEEKLATPETTPKRPRASPGKRRKSQMSPVVLHPAPSRSPACQRSSGSSRKKPAESPAPGASAGRKSPSNPAANSRRPSPGSPAMMKRNHKGETPLHVASIKGDVEAVKELLDQGADPNQKDNAGWTPLHEACNLGHLPVVEVLVTSGALLNTPGYKNDSPLHDAVRNGRPAIVELLLRLGASQNVLNLDGKRPADYAVGLEMLQIFQEAAEGSQRAAASPGPSAGLAAVGDCAMGDGELVVLPSKLGQPEQSQLGRLAELLGGRVADAFSTSVSHVVLPEGDLPTTFSTLLGLLAGCWVVRFSWAKACLQAGKWTPETEHEAGDGPRRSRVNRCSLLPPLFDGCFFFLHGSFQQPSRAELVRLLRAGGGRLLSRQPKPDSDVTQTLNAAAYHAEPGSDQALCTQYIVFDGRGGAHRPAGAGVRRGKVWWAPSSWLIDCIAAFRLLPVPDPQTAG
ncbi:BRCA1-associated RING domain protein 1 [Nelusetta ayraudi]|uniref:BRCA1-associated RING domain protein 1 n=1 Tax=Nelusetta ayraudi TaxID=303726 RepID=UPI003F6FEDA3